MHAFVTLAREDFRIGFEASSRYYDLPLDLVEKVVSCRDILNRDLPGMGAADEH